MYLLGSIIVGLLLPLISYVPAEFDFVAPIISPEVSSVYHSQLEYISTLSDTAVPINEPEIESWSWLTLLYLIYALGLIYFVLRSMLIGIKLIALISNGTTKRHADFTELILANDHPPFSFFRYICLGNLPGSNDQKDNILSHELHHVKSFHSIDVLFVELVKIVFWWNPIIYLFKRFVSENHEFSADAKVLENHSRRNYCELLMRSTFPEINLQLCNPFFQSFIKKRINMMYQKKSNRINLLKYSVSLLAFFFLLTLFAKPTKGQKVKWDKIGEVLNLGDTPIPAIDELTVTINDKELTEDIDYRLNRANGKLYLIENENTKGQNPVKVKFNEKDKPLIEGTGSEEEALRNVGQRKDTMRVIDKSNYELDISKLRVGQILRINELNFEADASILNPESFGILDEVYEFLVAHKNVVVEIGGHTNATPSHAYCDKLSTERAKNVAEYITNRGVNASRISYYGYGKRKPLAESRSAYGRKMNQRVEVKILAL